MGRRSPPRITLDAIRRTVLPAPNGIKSLAPTVVVTCWCGLVTRMDRPTLDRFTRDIWARFDEGELEPLKWAILRRRRVLARQAWP